MLRVLVENLESLAAAAALVWLFNRAAGRGWWKTWKADNRLKS